MSIGPPTLSRGPRLSRRLAPLRYSLNGLAALLARQVELIGALEVHPEVSRHAKILAQAQGRIRRYIPLSRQKLIKAVRRYFDNVGELLRRKACFLPLLADNFSGMHWCAGPGLFLSSVVG